MIFFRKKKPEPPPEPPLKKAESSKKDEASPAAKATKPLQEILHTRVLTAEGWRRRLAEKRLAKKK